MRDNSTLLLSDAILESSTAHFAGGIAAVDTDPIQLGTQINDIFLQIDPSRAEMRRRYGCPITEPCNSLEIPIASSLNVCIPTFIFQDKSIQRYYSFPAETGPTGATLIRLIPMLVPTWIRDGWSHSMHRHLSGLPEAACGGLWTESGAVVFLRSQTLTTPARSPVAKRVPVTWLDGAATTQLIFPLCPWADATFACCAPCSAVLRSQMRAASP